MQIGVPDITNEDYHNSLGLSSTKIKDILESTPEKYMAEWAEPSLPKRCFIFGNAFHTKILESKEFDKRYLTTAPDIPKRNTKEGKTVYEQWTADNLDKLMTLYKGKMDPKQWATEYLEWKYPGKIHLLEDEVEMLKQMQIANAENPRCIEILSDGQAELTYRAKCKETGFDKKCRPDWIKVGDKILVYDWKSCENASFFAFGKDVAKFGYHISGAWYVDIIAEAHNVPRENVEFLWVACEKKAPYGIAFWRMDEQSYDAGKTAYKLALKDHGEFLQTLELNNSKGEKTWAGYSLDFHNLTLPIWALMKYDCIEKGVK